MVLIVFRGEPGTGNWTLVVKDTVENDHSGNFTDWRITLWGESIDPAKAKPHPMPNDHDDDDHDVVSAIVGTTTLPPSSTSTSATSKPSDHIDRPVIDKPSAVTSTTLSGSPATSATELTASTAQATTSTSSTSTEASTASATSTPDTFLPSYFPTFGVSKTTQIWVVGATSVILLFCIGLGVSFCVLRRRRARTNRVDYDFEMLDDADASAALTGTTEGRRTRRRAGELYDAFAGESDEELLSEAESEPEPEYRDEKTEPTGEKLDDSKPQHGDNQEKPEA